MKNRAVFFDRDGTLNEDLGYVGRVEDLILFPDATKSIKLLNDKGFLVFVVSNQSGVGRGFFPQKAVEVLHEKMGEVFFKEGASIDGFYYCPHHPDKGCCCRKPSPQMVLAAAKTHDVSLKESYFVGDKISDVKTGLAAGCKTVLIAGDPQEVDFAKPQFVASNLSEATNWILKDSQR